jgi:N-acylmannosamine kinase
VILALDIGGTKTSAALIGPNLKIVEKRSISTQSPNWAMFARALRELIGTWQFDRVAVATTGRIVEGVLQPLNTEMISFWNALPITDELTKLFSQPVFVVNDAAAAAWGEFQCMQTSDGPLVHSILYLTISTGVGSGLIVNDRLVSSANGLASHAGHCQHSLPGLGVYHCSCGRTNCIETIASGTAIAHRATVACGETLSTIEVFARYYTHSECARVIDQAAHAISDLIVNMNATMGIDRAVLGGGVGLLDLFRERVRFYMLKNPTVFRAEITTAALGSDSGLVGVAQLSNKDEAG